VLHGGGQERDVRSGTLDTPPSSASRPRRAGGEAQPERAERLARCATTWSAGARGRPDAVLGGDPTCAAHRLPGNAHFSFPGCEGDALLLLLDARGIECSTGSACSAGVPQPSHVLLAMGVPEDAGPRLAAVLARPHLDRGRRRRGRRRDRTGGGRVPPRRPDHRPARLTRCACSPPCRARRLGGAAARAAARRP
jgi:hypothetical protein